ncbi:hypothetical protein LCGC14_0845090 [marine sediment metagenome]|uniref:Large polyvalent protein associated domain-containing protein n=1 Tax=marine sediment metagenome TaxID=412755 RepID=A0A0F9SJ42_9ZZZZ
MATLEEQVRGLSPEALDIFRKQLPQRLKELSPLDRNTALSQLQNLPEFQLGGAQPQPLQPSQPSIRQPQVRQETQQPLPWWQVPLQFLRDVEVGFGTFVTQGLTPAVPGTENLPWWQRERAEYDAWDEPSFQVQPLFRLPWTPQEIRDRPWTIGVKGAIETIPWFATALATGGLAGLAGVGAKTGLGGLVRASVAGQRALKPIIAAERAITAAPFKLAGKIASPITKPLIQAARNVRSSVTDSAARILTDLQPVDDAISIATQPSKMRNLVNMEIGGRKPLKALAESIGGRMATANNPATLSLVGRDVLRFEGSNKATAAIATLNRMGDSRRLFNLDADGLMTIGGSKVHLNEVRTFSKRYVDDLTDTQKAWVDQAQLLEREKKALFERYGIEVPELVFEEGGEYAGRRVVGKFDTKGNLIDTAYIGRSQPGKPGAKTAALKTRQFDDINDALAEGFRYLPEEEALYYNITGAYNSVANKQYTDWFLERVPWRTTAGPEDLKAQINLFRTGVSGARASLKTAHKRLKQSAGDIERQKGVTFRATEEVTDLLDEVSTGKALGQNVSYLRGRLQAEKKFANKLARTYANAANRNEAAYQKVLDVSKRLDDRLIELSEIEPIWKDALAKARKAPYGGTIAPEIPAFARKVFTSPEAKEYINILRQELNPQFNSALNAINQVNAVGRYFALAGDVSPFGIQLLFLAGAQPKIYGKAIKGFLGAFFDPLHQDNFLAKHIGTIQRHPNLITTKGGATEMTEAMAKGGMLRRGPLKIAGKVLEPFQRGFESALDTAGIYMAEAYEHLGTTPARMAQVDAFINEFRGLLSTTRLGVSNGQRQLERAIILAPQYNRAIGALMYDLTQGNLRGQLAREAMAKGTAAIMAMTVAVSMALGEDEDEIVDHLNPLSTNFMTWDVAGQRIGPGSKVRSLLFTFGKMTKRPEDTANLAGRFLRGNFSPFLGTSMDLITGKDFMGDPTRDGLPSLTRTILAENLLPIWVQSVALEGGDFSGRLTRGLGEFAGMRAYPQSAFAELKDKQDELSQAQYGMSWNELGQRPEGFVLQSQLARDPDIQELTTLASEQSEKFARSEQLVWNEYTSQADRIGGMVTQELDQAARQFEATGDGRQLRERVNQAYWLKSQMMNDLLKQDKFVVVRDAFNVPLSESQRNAMQPQKLLYRDYNQIMYAPDLYDEFGEYRFDEADRRREMFIQQYGLEALDSVESVIGERRVDEPIAVKLLRQARKTLQPYWDIEGQVWQQYPPELKQISDQIIIKERADPLEAKRQLFNYPQIVLARRQIALLKRQLKFNSPEIANALNTFYGK